MSLVLAATWHPRGELARLIRLLPELKAVYTEIIVITPPDKFLGDAGLAGTKSLTSIRDVLLRKAEEWSFGRRIAIETALETNCDFVHYADMDRLLRWVETHPSEWREACRTITKSECVIMGRTPAAYRTHPKALISTEAISNRVVSYFLGRSMDVSAGSKGFNRKAVEYLMTNTVPVSAMGTDAQWVLTLFQAGFSITYIEVDGLAWESADRYLDSVAGEESQRWAARLYDEDPANWADRVEVAREIVETALSVSMAGRETAP